MTINMAARIIKHRKLVLITFIIATIVSMFAIYFVKVNHNIADYLPEEAESTIAVDIMQSEFESSVPNVRVMVKDLSLQEALLFKEQFEAIDGVSQVLWLDDVLDLKVPLEMADQETIEAYYKDGNALFSISIDEGEEVPVTDTIYELIGEEGAIAGAALDTAQSQKMAFTETLYATLLLIPVIIIILIISTTSWVEPLFFLIAIGVSVLINLGTNIFVGEISFVTQSVAPILQLAVSIDYAVFLLHSFHAHRKTMSPELAMQHAMKESFPTITVSAVTTFFGFIALTLMDFGIGADLGLNLVKGIVFSYLSVMIFLPALTVTFYKWMDKTQHKNFVPTTYKGVGKFVFKAKIPSLIIALLIIVPSFLAQSSTSFIYGIGEHPESTRAGADFKAIEEAFGEVVQMVVLVPKGDLAKEVELVEDFEQIHNVTGVMSYVNTVDATIPPEYLDESITNQFFSENYSRIIINTNAGKEGDVPFSIVEKVRETVSTYYGNEGLVLGESVTLYDMKTTVTRDNTFVNVLTIIAIGLVLLITYRSISLPIILLLTIQIAVWVNLSVPYFTDTALIFIGYLIVSTVQLAATIDYAILFTDTYKELRKEMPVVDAVKKTLNDKTFSISISAAILASVGFILWLTNSNPVISSIGMLVGRGALLAFFIVLFVLPALLIVLDKVIKKTTYKSNFLEGRSK